jgi:hypothetical protein
MARTYTTYYLRFASQEEAETKFTEVNYLHEDTFEGETHTYYAVKDQVGDIDIVGEIWNDDGVYEEDSETFEITIVTPPTKMDGWHINIILEESLPEALQPYIVTPQHPHRVFA